MAKRGTPTLELQARAAAYRLLSGAFHEPVPARVDAGALREALAALPEYGDLPAVPEPPADLEAEARRVFGHNLSPDCPPYETQYEGGGIFRRTQELADLAGFYRAFGLDLAPGDRRPDHLPVELEFTAILCLKESVAIAKGRIEEAAVCRAARVRFLGEHLGRWTGAFAAAAEGKAPGSYFARIASLAAALIALDAAALGADTTGPGPARAVPQDPRESGCISCIGGHVWVGRSTRPLAACILFLAIGVGAEDLETRARKLDGAVSLDPADAAWAAVGGVDLSLMPQQLAPPGGGGAVKTVQVKVAEHGHDIFFRLEWADKTLDEGRTKAEGFSDAAALQFPVQPETIPSPLMGDEDAAVAIWRWSAAAEKDLDAGWQGNAQGRPRLSSEMYPFADDATFRAGEKAGNIISDRRRPSPVESLAAKGFGTLTPTAEQPVKGRGVWKNGRWAVVFQRAVTGLPGFHSGARIPFAVAAWDGGARERNGVKSVSVWQSLALPGAPPRPALGAVAQGRRHFLRYGCATCHGKDAAAGAANPNAQTSPIPPLNRVKEGFTKDEIVAVILKGRESARADPSGPPARLRMAAWEAVMSRAEAEAVADYLFSLMPKDGGEW